MCLQGREALRARVDDDCIGDLFALSEDRQISVRDGRRRFQLREIAVAVRQWVLSLPFELRKLAAFDARVLAALVRIFAEVLAKRYRAWAKRDGLGEAQAGAVTFVQRFGSSVNLHVHFHVMVLDGVFIRDAHGVPRFHEATAPTRADLDAVARRVHRRALAWLARHGHVDASGLGASEATEPAPLDACAAIAMHRGNVRAVADAGGDAEGSEASAPETPAVAHGAVDFEGFNLHASVRIDADDDLGRERLCRYGARPPLALDRLRVLPGGRVAYRIKKLRDGRAKTRVMTPVEFLARLAALVPPPRYPLVRYHGVLAPRSSWRRDVVPRPPAVVPCPRRTSVPTTVAKASSGAGNGGPSLTTPDRQRRVPNETCHTETSSRDARALVAAPAAGDAELLSPNLLSVAHWSRLLDGLLYAKAPRIDWATLLQRSFAVDVLECTKCGGRLRVLGSVTEPEIVRAILERLGMPAEAPRAARARDPTELEGDELAD